MKVYVVIDDRDGDGMIMGVFESIEDAMGCAMALEYLNYPNTFENNIDENGTTMFGIWCHDVIPAAE